jgi:muramoyltetrapeptide carboxypeptidase
LPSGTQNYKAMLIPPYLKKGDRIGIVSTARKITPQELQNAVDVISGWGLHVVAGENLFNSFNQFAGTDEQRWLDIQKMLDDDSIKAIFCARGGYGTVRVIDKINWDGFLKSPKWIAGFSDVTVLHAHLQQVIGSASIHCAMPINFTPDASRMGAIESVQKALFGEKIAYEAPSHQLNRKGEARSMVIGGNLSILYSVTGTVSQPDTQGKILVLEDLDEYLYHIDRMMMNLKRTGMLNNLAGLIIGGMTEMKDNTVAFGFSAEEIIYDSVKEFNYPVCFGFPTGHIENNLALYFGKEAEMIVNERGTSLSY